MKSTLILIILLSACAFLAGRHSGRVSLVRECRAAGVELVLFDR